MILEALKLPLRGLLNAPLCFLVDQIMLWSLGSLEQDNSRIR